MIFATTRLMPNAAEVAAKVIDGEAILIHLPNGTYYSMDGVGALVWELIDANQTLREIVESITTRFDVSSELARADVERLVRELLSEKLVLLSNDGRSSALTRKAESERLPYEPPRLNVYRDMADLLALDPPMPSPPGGLEDDADSS
jgi:hypothetical protein